jgi:hypothetical protein
MSYKLSVFVFLLSVAAFGQTLSGTLSLHTQQELSLTTFNAYDAVERTTTTVDSLGNFTLAFDTNYTGIALLQTQDQSTLPLLLTPTDIQLKGSHLKARSALTITPALNNQFLHYEEEAYPAKTHFVGMGLFARILSKRTAFVITIPYPRNDHQGTKPYCPRRKTIYRILRPKQLFALVYWHTPVFLCHG